MNFQIVELTPVCTSDNACVDAVTPVGGQYDTYESALVAMIAYQREDTDFGVYAVVTTTFNFPIRSAS